MPFLLRYRHPILIYHRVGQKGDPTITVSEEGFTRQMTLLKDENRLIRLEELASLLTSEISPLSKKVAVTFDDGYMEIYTSVFPLIERYHIPVTVFLVTGWIGRGEFLSWEAIQEMSKKGVDFGSHTKNHPYLPAVMSRETLEEEIRGSKEFLEDRLGKEVSLFSYPVGGFTEEVKELVQKAGYKAAVTTNRGVQEEKRDLYALTRIKMTEASSSFWVFRVKTSGYYEQFQRKKRAY